jgi:hypothetical protein
MEQAVAFKIKHRIDEVRKVISEERAFQDSKWGSVDLAGHSLAEWVLIAEAELAEAKLAVIKGGSGRNSVRSEIVQTIAVLHACLEQHGVEDDHDGRAL